MASNPMRDFNMAAVWAGLTAFVWYAFGALPLHLDVARDLTAVARGLDDAPASNFMAVVMAAWYPHIL